MIPDTAVRYDPNSRRRYILLTHAIGCRLPSYAVGAVPSAVTELSMIDINNSLWYNAPDYLNIGDTWFFEWVILVSILSKIGCVDLCSNENNANIWRIGTKLIMMTESQNKELAMKTAA